jgi:superfamily I DNA/RNA helicase
MPHFLSQLNQDQQNAIDDQGQVVLVKAGPGTGKTLTLIAKILALIKSGVDLEKIAAITFTHKAAQEIEDRLKKNIGNDVVKLNLGTFHSFALKKFDGLEEQLLTEPQVYWLVRNIASINKTKLSTKDLLLIISKLKNNQKFLKNCKPLVVKVYQEYQQQLKQNNKIDYDDLLSFLLSAVKRNQLKRVKYLLVDEFQDVSPLQYDIIKNWIPGLSQTFLIGDSNQAIYGFRGATSQSFSQLKKDFPDCLVYNLALNYRNSPEILLVAQRMTDQEFQIKPTVKEQGEVKLINTFNQHTEADWILKDIEEKLGGTGLISASELHQQAGASFGNFAVVYRIHQLGKVIEEKIKQAGLPFQKLGSESLYQQPLIQLVINLWQLVSIFQKGHPEKEEKTTYQEILINKYLNISPKGVEKIFQYQQQHNLEDSLVLNQISKQKILNRSDFNKISFILETLEKLLVAVKSYDLTNLLKIIYDQLELRKLANFTNKHEECWSQFKIELLQFSKNKRSLTNFLDFYRKLERRGFYSQNADKISLSSMHAVKGLEFDWVYLIGFEEGLIPLELKKGFKPINDHQTQLQEEKNLVYVALTRAKKGVYLMNCQKRWQQKSRVSSFYKLILGKPLVEITDEKILKMAQKQQQVQDKSRQGKLF